MFLVIGLLITCCSVEGLWNIYPKFNIYPVFGDVGEPLFLTPLIETGQIVYGRHASRVHLNGTDIVSYSGFLTVNKKYNSNMFFWFFPAETDYISAPVVTWLQGGPGGSSIVGLFEENGPFYLDKMFQLKHRDIYWSQIANIIYIDNPIGTGYSFTDNDEGYATNEDDVGRDLYSFLIQFFQLFPELKDNDFFITGESYAGKYIPAISYTIHKNNQKNDNKINLKGFAIGDGWCDPEHHMKYGDYLFEIGLIDNNQRNVFLREQEMITKYINDKNYIKAFERNHRLMIGKSSYFYNFTGFEFVYNYLYNKFDSINGDEGDFVQKNYVRKIIHVGNLTFHDGGLVARKLLNDTMQSVKPWIEILLEEYKVIIYNGQLDIIVAYPLTINFIKSLKWTGAEEYSQATRQLWYVDNELAGYFKIAKNLTEVLVRNAGHMVPSDQPKWALQLLKNLIMDEQF